MAHMIGLHTPREKWLLLGMDTVLVSVGLLLAVAIRFPSSREVADFLHSAEVGPGLGLAVLLYDFSLYYNELYDLRISRRLTVTFVRLVQATIIASLSMACLSYAIPALSLGRGVCLVAAPAVLVLLTAWRVLFRERGPFVSPAGRLLIVGTAEPGIHLVREIVSQRDPSLKVVGFLDERGENIGKSLVNPGIVGAVSEMAEIAAREKVSTVVVSLAERRGHMPLRELLRLKLAGISVEDAQSVHERITGRIELDHVQPSALIFSDGFRKSTILTNSKRAVDLVVALAGLFLASPLMGLVVLAIWLETGSPVLFRQRRIGLWGREFEMLKFRSMVQNAEADGPAWASDRDPRVTRVGAFIRKYRLDELPQLYNVLRGEMSLVGPRPEQPALCVLLERQIPLFLERHSVRPGITGWAQTRYHYGSSVEDAKRKLEFDLFYIKHLSILMDLTILLETLKVMLFGRGSK